MHVRGVRALRLDLFLRSSLPTSELIAYIERSVRRTEPLGWHVQFYTPGWVVRDLLPFLSDLEADFVIDHMGYMLESDGLTRADFDRLLTVVASGRGWIKLSAPITSQGTESMLGCSRSSGGDNGGRPQARDLGK